MKVIITESQLNNTIEKLIKSVNKDVVSVQFVPKKVGTFENGKMTHYEKTIIKIVLDPHDILGGNFHTRNSPLSMVPLYLKVRQEIQQALSRFINIDTTESMSPYDVEYYVIGTTSV